MICDVTGTSRIAGNKAVRLGALDQTLHNLNRLVKDRVTGEVKRFTKKLFWNCGEIKIFVSSAVSEKTALLPRIKIREVKSPVGKSTEHAMLVGAVHGYRGLVRELIGELKRELKAKRLPVVATGGYAKLIASKLPEISAVEPNLTLEGLRLVWMLQRSAAVSSSTSRSSIARK